MSRSCAQKKDYTVVQKEEDHILVFVPQHEGAVHGQGINEFPIHEDVCPIGSKHDAQNR